MRALSHARGPKCYVLVFDLNKIERVDLTAQRIDSALRIMFEQREDNTHSKKKNTQTVLGSVPSTLTLTSKKARRKVRSFPS